MSESDKEVNENRLEAGPPTSLPFTWIFSGSFFPSLSDMRSHFVGLRVILLKARTREKNTAESFFYCPSDPIQKRYKPRF